MAIEPAGWTGFSGGEGASCSISTPSISGATDMDCQGAASVSLSVSGGVGPYSWATTLGNLSDATGPTTTLTPPANPWTGASGTNAYGIATKHIDVFCSCRASIWDCYGNQWQTCAAPNSLGCWQACGGAACTCTNCTTAADAVCDTSCNPNCSCGKSACGDAEGWPESNAHCFCITGTGDCQPCAISMNGGAVVTVTDSLGQTAFVTILPTPRTTL